MLPPSSFDQQVIFAVVVEDGLSRLVGELNDTDDRADFDEVCREFYGRRGDVESDSCRMHTLGIHVELTLDLVRPNAVCSIAVEIRGRYGEVFELCEGAELHWSGLFDLVGLDARADDDIDACTVLRLSSDRCSCRKQGKD